MTPDEDRDLRERFRALRTEDQAAAPALDGSLARAHGGGDARRLAPYAVALAAAAVLVVVALLPGRDGARTSPVPSLTDWRSPTDFLLRSPGREILDTLPRFGEGLLHPDSTERRISS